MCTVVNYTKSKSYTFNPQYLPHNDKLLTSHYGNVEPETGRRYTLDNLINPNKDRPNLDYEFLGVKRVWRWTKERMHEAYEQGLVVQPSPGAVPRHKCYLDEQSGMAVDSIWSDIPPINSQAGEGLGYPTQKPLALLNRIIEASSYPGDVVLDAFCGCGTTLHAAQNLGRRWLGIDVSPTACRVMAQRLVSQCHITEGKDFWVRGLPKTAEELRKYPPFEFENWAVTALNTVISNGHAIANRAKVGDMGIGGRIYPASTVKEKNTGYDLFGETDRWYPVQVKQQTKETGKVGRPAVPRVRCHHDPQRGVLQTPELRDQLGLLVTDAKGGPGAGCLRPLLRGGGTYARIRREQGGEPLARLLGQFGFGEADLLAVVLHGLGEGMGEAGVGDSRRGGALLLTEFDRLDLCRGIVPARFNIIDPH